MQVFETHLGGGGAERRREPALEELPRALGIERTPAKRLGGAAHLLAGRTDANEEVGDDVDAHPVLGDQALRLAARHLDPHHIHANRHDFVQDRNDEGAAADDDLLAAESGPDEGGFLGRTPVEPAQQVDSDHHDDRQNNQPKDHRTDCFGAHCNISLKARFFEGDRFESLV